MVYAFSIMILSFTPASDDTLQAGNELVFSPSSADNSMFQNPTRELNYLQMYATYEPGPGPGIYGQYVLTLFPPGYKTTTLGWKSQLFGSLAYTYDFELDLMGYEQISFTPELFSDFEPNRILNEVNVDERRSGGSLLTTYQRRFRDEYHFSQYVKLQHMRVWLGPEDGQSSLTDISSIALGPRFTRSALTGLLPADILIEGHFTIGLDHKHNSIYNRLRLGNRLHLTIGRGFAWNGELKGEWAGRNVPIFENPSFGGSFSVRGYSQDELLGRVQLTTQQELWIPIPGTMSSVRGLGYYLRQHIRLAAFADAAVISRTVNPGQSGIRTGAGIGLRFRTGGVTLRADWGHRLTDIRDGRFKGNFFLSIRPDLRFFLF
jgi:hypothetical protein